MNVKYLTIKQKYNFIVIYKTFLIYPNRAQVRSYGGSIKNLDESDGDLDKKYQSSYNNLSEYKLRPRLTSKYATLYADSLSNYNPPQATVNASKYIHIYQQSLPIPSSSIKRFKDVSCYALQ